jgi:hypothetical protein
MSFSCLQYNGLLGLLILHRVIDRVIVITVAEERHLFSFTINCTYSLIFVHSNLLLSFCDCIS